MSLQINFSMECPVGVDSSSAEKPHAHAVVVEIVGELGDYRTSIADNLGIDDLDTGDDGGGQMLVVVELGEGKGRSAEREGRDNAADLHFVVVPG